ncbi:probable DNA metabolism protein [Sinomicrobium oceani]|uniref:Probable DNA metabolism protein n=1 Tax=Sinomicrobium oceani TaxID=1150368 RepID=A0A1K1RXQ5_9FLAO|nr:TIGR03915 family putative DNA repair protein [Sinomicrobium oceani]SFW76936.1 probable DNA metabolism protein [Sinomicrobium oceani]
MYYLFDGSYAGFLTCVFESFEHREFSVTPITSDRFTGDFFRDNREVITDAAKAKRVQRGLRKKLDSNRAMDFFRVYLSEDPEAWQAAFRMILRIFDTGPEIMLDFGDNDVIFFAQTLKKVGRERHRMKAFIRFQKSSDGMYFAIVEPDFNVLPLISGFFKRRYADQPWLIYDARRKYGLWYDGNTVAEVQLTPAEKDALSPHHIAITLDERDEHFQQLWQQYFKSTNIESRRNMKLHLRHVPRRYWKYLTEKNGM